jgi:hypothetical protein
MSAAVVILPVIWATAAGPTDRVAGSGMGPGPRKTGLQRQADAAQEEVLAKLRKVRRPDPAVAFYRKYTEALLRRYVRMSMGAGRVPSLLGRELFRGKVSNYRVEGFDDMVIFVEDVAKCVAKLDRGQQILIERIALQEYTQEETSEMLRLPLRSVLRFYADALDLLTEMFLEKKLLEPQKACQEARTVDYCVNY